MRLGRGQGPQEIPVPVSDDDHSPKRHRRGGDGQGGGPGLNLDMATMQQLLAQHKQIVESNQAHLDQAVAALEDRLSKRLDDSGLRHDMVEERVGGIESRLQKLEEFMQQGGGRDATGDDRRKLTLVLGGWRQDTPRKTILSEVTEALQRLGLQGHTDKPAFTTGSTSSSFAKPKTIDQMSAASSRLSLSALSLDPADRPVVGGVSGARTGAAGGSRGGGAAGFVGGASTLVEVVTLQVPDPEVLSLGSWRRAAALALA